MTDYMKKYRELAKDVAQIFSDSEKTFFGYQAATGLTCLPECGHCCYNTQEIYATPLEMLPAAFDIIDRGEQQTFLKMLEQKHNNNDLMCAFFAGHDPEQFKGRCTRHQVRPCVCRSFGAAAIKNKQNEKALSVCKLIKEKYPEHLHEAQKNHMTEAPVIGNFALQVQALDYELSRELLPINQALYVILQKLVFLMDFEQESGQRS
jgi:Fe-S-cluster containining protein